MKLFPQLITRKCGVIARPAGWFATETWIGLIVSLVGFAGPLCFGQTPVPAPTQANPFAQLMLSQPSIDITSPVVAHASFDPPAVRPGQKAILRITLNAISTAVQLPDPIPGPPELTFRLGAQGQILQPAGNALRPLTAINFEVRVSKPGFYLVPAFVVGVYGRPVVIPAAGLEVSPEVEADQAAREIVVEASATNVFVGEALNVRVLLPSSSTGPVEMLREVQINGDDLFVDKSTVRQAIRMEAVNGKKLPTYVYETQVMPIKAGELTLSAQGFAAGWAAGGLVVGSGPTTLPGPKPEFQLLDSEPVTIHVRMLPPGGELPGFTGAIGDFSCDAPHLSTNQVKVGDLVEMWVAIRGEGNLARLVPPEPPHVRGWQSFPGVLKGYAPPTTESPNGGAVFSYTFIPLSDELKATPVIPFSYFNPQSRTYVDLTIPSVSLTVLDDGAATNAVAWPDLGRNYPEEKRPALSGVVATRGKTVARLEPLQAQGWFILVQLAPVAVLGGLWWWDRRRRYLERHPEILRQRRARRELRRLKRRLHRAVATGDAAGFTDCGVNALRVACAPHYPANPRALVCADVLEVFPAAERQGKREAVIRRLFAAADEASFATAHAGNNELITLNTELDEILQKLEARL